MNNCDKCGIQGTEEVQIELSHNVPRYMFLNKNEADKYGRNYLCKKCHAAYEIMAAAKGFDCLPEEVKAKVYPIISSYGDWWVKQKFYINPERNNAIDCWIKEVGLEIKKQTINLTDEAREYLSKKQKPAYLLNKVSESFEENIVLTIGLQTIKEFEKKELQRGINYR